MNDFDRDLKRLFRCLSLPNLQHAEIMQFADARWKLQNTGHIKAYHAYIHNFEVKRAADLKILDSKVCCDKKEKKNEEPVKKTTTKRSGGRGSTKKDTNRRQS